MPGLIAAELRQQGITGANISAPHDEQRAVDEALALCGPGDLLIIFGDNIARCWKQIVRFREQSQPGGSQRGTLQSQVGSLTGQLAAIPTHAAATDRAGERAPAAVPRGTGDNVVEDTRGVRLARPQELED